MASSPSATEMATSTSCVKWPRSWTCGDSRTRMGEMRFTWLQTMGICRSASSRWRKALMSTRALTGETPILLAACDGDINVLMYLLDRGGDPATPNVGGFTPLHYAAEYGHVDVVRLLLSKGVHVDPLNYSGVPLHLATTNDHDQVLKVLLEHGADAGADVNDKRSTGPRTTPLAFAVDNGLADIVKILLGAGADPNIRNEDGMIPIMVAAARGQRELVEILFPRTKPIPCLPDFSVDGIIRTMRFPRTEPQDAVPVERLVSDSKSNGKEAFAKGEYILAIYFYTKALDKTPLDATLFANRSLCWLRLREGD